jgi:RHS repeat-associated protein
MKKLRTTKLRKGRRLLPIFLLWLVVCSCSNLYAQFDGGITDPYNGVAIGTAAPGGTITLAPGATAFTTCPAGGSAEITGERKIVNIVRLVLNEESNKYLPADFVADVQVKIEYGPNASSLSQLIQTFTVTYNKTEGTKYNAKNYLSFEGAQYVKITIQTIPSITPGGVNLADVLYVENEMRVTRYFELQAGITLPTFSTVTLSNSPPVDGYTASWSAWPANAGNNATQLEWTWLENELQSNYYIPNTTTVDVEKLFSENATRVDLLLSQLTYKIPLFYDGQGKLYYRVRPVNIYKSGSRADGQWSAPGIVNYDGHNNSLNWQVRTSFAEEGKLKSVMEYYDGSLRSRQTVTKENVNNTTVTAETMYDYEGRPVIQILPVPGINNIIKYQANLNKFNGQASNQNPAEFFDLTLNSAIGTAALYGTPAMATTTGAARYYSNQNDELNTAPNKNIPDAEGYPYSVTRYMPDGTGRILAQSGVGAAHKMASTRETKYYYGTPAQEELDGLFGTEVGNRSHYFKNMVKDANGQMSVSYTDMHGRTIATALAGETPGNLLALNISDPVQYPNQAGSTITRNLLSRETNIEKGNSIESINSILVPAPTSYEFHYELNPQTLQLNSCTSTPICYDCLYDLEISITDESGDVVPIVRKYNNLSLGIDEDCNTEPPKFQEVDNPIPRPSNIIGFTEVLQPGSYSIRKTLTISEASLDYYKQQYLQPGKGICKTEQEIIDSVYSILLSTSSCNTPPTAPCASCLTQLGTYAAFDSNYLASIGVTPPANQQLTAEIQAAYNSALQNCNNICNTTSQLTASKRQLMLADMMPYGGQYATQAAPTPLVSGSGTAMFQKYNIFQTTYNGSIQPYYQKPEDAAGQPDFYRDELGNIDLQIHPRGTNTLLNSLNPDGFANIFVNNWAEALLPYHPEYPRLLYAEGTLANANVYNWINSFNNTTTYAGAVSPANGDPTYIIVSNATITDPFYTIASAPYKTDMTTWVTSNYSNNLSLWQIARGQMRCQNAPNKQVCFNNSYNLSGQLSKVPPFSDITDTADKDQLWQNFRNLYASARDNQVNKFIKEFAPLPDDQNLINQGYQLRFGTNEQTAQQYNWQWYPTTPGGIPPVLPPATATTTYQGRCSSYISQWRTALQQCEALNSLSSTVKEQVLTEITNGMVSVCTRGSDAANPYGSSTVAPAQVSGTLPNSFEQVITQVFASYSIATNNSYYCNPYVIEFPKPYGKGPKFANEITTVVDSCACSHFDSLKVKVTAANYNPLVLASINTYLQVNNMDTITAVLHTALLNCSNYRVQVCDTIYVSKTVSCYDPSPCTDECVERSKRSGSTGFTEAVPASCADWDFLISCFYEIYGATINTNPSVCRTNFVAHFNSFYPGNNFTTWFQVDSTYKANCNPAGLNVCTNCTTTVSCPVLIDCRWVFAPYFLSSPQPLPDYLKCGGWPPQKKCLTCDSMFLRTTEFKTKFNTPYNAGPIFTGTNLTPEQIKQNILYSQYLNFKTGFQFGWMQYAQAAAAANCDPLTGGGGGTTDLVVTTRNGNTPAQYIASNSIIFDPNFESGVNDEFETLIQPNGGGNGTQIVICRDNRPLNDTTGLFVVDTPCHRIRMLSVSLGQHIYQQQLLSIQAGFERQYRAKCMAAKNAEIFTVEYTNKEYHYTLYYYDMAGSLVKTVPPKGVKPDYTTIFLNSVKTARENCRNNDAACDPPVVPLHTLVTQYRYNSLGQVIAQNSPDANTSKFWYDRLGRLVVSQNAQQAIPSGGSTKYSYTRYDALGRITEVGQKPHNTAMSQTISQDDAQLNTWITQLTNGGGIREQITLTGYDIEFEPNRQPLIHQQNLRNRVSYTAFRNFENDVQPPPFYTGTIYTYDIHGNVDTLLQDYSGVSSMSGSTNSFKRITYGYDLISGKVNMVSYQPGETDAFFHKYKYDAENRLTEAWTSRDKIEWERDAAYNYYKHGPLSRTVIGQLQVQGVDYAYTIQGWLKGVNSTAVGDGTYDMGNDGKTGGPEVPRVARDIYGFGLHYFDNGSTEMDYKAIGSANVFARPNNNAFKSLYNGNIGAMSVNNAGLLKGPALTTNALPLFYNYRYDQLNRIKSMNAFKGLNSSNQWVPVPVSAGNDYAETVSYDPNGNILGYNRNGAAVTGNTAMDQLHYKYYYVDNNDIKQQYDPVTGPPASGVKSLTNQLASVKDDITTTGGDDIKDQADKNYEYDAIGNLIKDTQEGIDIIKWTVYGKIASITKTNGDIITYTYDAAGNRITKTAPAAGGPKTTVYVRDASGNVMSVYEKLGAGATEQTETHLYGSSRIGIANKLTVTVSNIGLSGGYGTAHLSTFTRGEKLFELSNHLGNVLVTISDKKIGVDNNSDGTVDYYNADVTSAQDFYLFGFKMPGRQWNNGGYRYGFNGREEDDEVKGDGNSLDYKNRIYDPRVGRFLSVDPIADEYPQLAPYQFASNQPIESIDMDGMERWDYRAAKGDDGKAKLTFVSEGPKRGPGGRILGIRYEGREIPLHTRIEYNGQHYIFIDGRRMDDLAYHTPEATGYAQKREALHYMADYDKFLANPDEFAKTYNSEEQVGVPDPNWGDDAFVQGVAELVDETVNRPIPGRPAKARIPTVNTPKPKTSANKPAMQQKVAATPNIAVKQKAAAQQKSIVKPPSRAPEFAGGQTTETGFLNSALSWLGKGYKDMGGGRYVSADGLKQIRYGKHETTGKNHHGHFEIYDKPADQGGKVTENTMVKIVPDANN